MDKEDLTKELRLKFHDSHEIRLSLIYGKSKKKKKRWDDLG